MDEDSHATLAAREGEAGGGIPAPVGACAAAAAPTHAAPPSAVDAAPAAGGPSALTGTVLVWFRRDLRVADNPALATAAAHARHIVPVFIYAPEEEGQFQPGRCSRWWLRQSLAALDADLGALGGRLVLRRAPSSLPALRRLAAEAGATALVFNHLYDPISLVRDDEVKAGLAGDGLWVQSFNGDVLREPWDVLSPDGTPYATFEEYWAAASGPGARPWPPPAPPPPAPLPPPPPGFSPDDAGLSLDDVGLLTPEEAHSNAQLAHAWTPGSRGAHGALRAFVADRLAAFDADRAKADRASTSRLSPHLHWGEVSVRAVARLVTRAGARLAVGGGGGGGSGGGAGSRRPPGPAAAGSEASPRAPAAAAAVAPPFPPPHPAGSAAESPSPPGPATGSGGGGGGGSDPHPGAEAPPPPPPLPPPTKPSATVEDDEHAAWRACPAASAFLRQVGFREYARYLCFHYPFSHERALLAHLRAAPWRLDQRAFKAWRQGRTGYPLVDAGMRELWATGWLHNRARVVCASFLVKHLRLPWQWGLKHFWDALVDADLECCVLGWQYVSGGLADAHPFSYMVDVTGGLGGSEAAGLAASGGCGGGGGGGVAAGSGGGTGDPSAIARAVGRGEAGRYDPAGRYVRRWLPALARLPDAWIHAPWAAPAPVLADAGVDLGPDGCYPLPIVSPAAAATGLMEAAAAIEAAETVSGGGGGDGGSGQGGRPAHPRTVGPFVLSLGGGSGGGSGARGGTGTGTGPAPALPSAAATAAAAARMAAAPVGVSAGAARPPPGPAATQTGSVSRPPTGGGAGDVRGGGGGGGTAAAALASRPAPVRTVASCGGEEVVSNAGGGGVLGGPTPRPSVATAAASGGGGGGPRAVASRPPPVEPAEPALATVDAAPSTRAEDDEVVEEADESGGGGGRRRASARLLKRARR